MFATTKANKRLNMKLGSCMNKMFVLLLKLFCDDLRLPKQDSAADAQLAQRKTELDAREKALDEREKSSG